MRASTEIPIDEAHTLHLVHDSRSVAARWELWLDTEVAECDGVILATGADPGAVAYDAMLLIRVIEQALQKMLERGLLKK